MSEPTPTAVPADLAARMAALVTRMTARGMMEPVAVYGRATVNSPVTGQPAARQRALLGTITGYVATGGGSETPAIEGRRDSQSHMLYFVPDGTGVLTEANYRERWVVLANRANGYHRVTDMQVVGPYAWALLEYGGTADAAGNLA